MLYASPCSQIMVIIQKKKKKSANKYIHGGHVGNNRKDKAGILVLSLNANEMHGQFCRLTLYFNNFFPLFNCFVLSTNKYMDNQQIYEQHRVKLLIMRTA